jgi:hypothetical protein
MEKIIATFDKEFGTCSNQLALNGSVAVHTVSACSKEEEV